MAPEQLVGKESYESDLYSFGAIMHSLLTGRAPVELTGTVNLKEKLRIVYRGKRVATAEANGNLKADPVLRELSGIIDRMLELNPSKRPTLPEVSEPLKSLWAAVGDQEKLAMPIRYEVTAPEMKSDSTDRITTDLLEVRSVII
jgi:serine/threonine protein kinase